MRAFLTMVVFAGLWVLAWSVATGWWSRMSRAGRSAAREQSGAAAANPLLLIPVPWVFLLGYLIGAGVQWLVPLRFITTEELLMARWIGLVVLTIGILLAFTALGLFKKSRTTTVPFDKPSQLVLRGPYRFTRNPMYLGLTLIYVGVAGSRGELWPLAVLVLVVLYVNTVVIPLEEGRLLEVFGEEYGRYCLRVRRWV